MTCKWSNFVHYYRNGLDFLSTFIRAAKVGRCLPHLHSIQAVPNIKGYLHAVEYNKYLDIIWNIFQPNEFYKESPTSSNFLVYRLIQYILDSNNNNPTIEQLIKQSFPIHIALFLPVNPQPYNINTLLIIIAKFNFLLHVHHLWLIYC